MKNKYEFNPNLKRDNQYIPDYYYAFFFDTMNSHRKREQNENFVTRLLSKGVKEATLTERHFNEIPYSIQDVASTGLGTRMHEALEVYAKNFGCQTEVELFKTFTIGEKHYDIVGHCDAYDPELHRLYDYKFSKVPSYLDAKRELKQEWHRQMASYVGMLREAGVQIDDCVVLVFNLDHSNNKTEQDYPEHIDTLYYDFKTEESEKYIEETFDLMVEKFKAQLIADSTEDDDIPPCSLEERWEDPRTVAVYSKTQKGTWKARADKLFERTEDALLYVAEQNGCIDSTHKIEQRQNKPVKCLRYCKACQFCNFYKEHVASLVSEETEE